MWDLNKNKMILNITRNRIISCFENNMVFITISVVKLMKLLCGLRTTGI